MERIVRRVTRQPPVRRQEACERWWSPGCPPYAFAEIVHDLRERLLSVSKPSGAAEPVESGAGSGAAVAKVYAALRMPILDGQIAPGTRINIDAVARKLGVSQTPVREA